MYQSLTTYSTFSFQQARILWRTAQWKTKALQSAQSAPMVLSKQAITRRSNALPVHVAQVHLLFNGDASHATPMYCVDENVVLFVFISEFGSFLYQKLWCSVLYQKFGVHVYIRSLVFMFYIRSCVLSGSLRFVCNCCD